MEDKREHLRFIQAVISRLASNSFLLKGWAVTLAAALIALGAHNAERSFVIVAYLPVVVFWVLDAYFLSLERCYRSLYEHVRVLGDGQVDFSMHITNSKKAGGNNWASAFFSPPVLIFYAGVAVAMLIVMSLVR